MKTRKEKEEKMAEQRIVNEKNPLGAAILSALFPGVGFFYIGNVLKGIAYILIFASLIVLIVEGRGNDAPMLGIMIGGFYIFQIFDSFNEAKRTRYKEEIVETNRSEGVSLTASVIILVIGVVFQLAELRLIRYREIGKFWPLILIAFGAKFLYSYLKSAREEQEREENRLGHAAPAADERGDNNE